MRKKRLMTALASATLILGTAGCAPGPDAVDGVAQMWVDHIDQVLGDDPSELEQQILANYEITDQDLSEAQEAHRRCTYERGVVTEWGADGSRTQWAAPGSELAIEDVWEVDEYCEHGTTSQIGFLHRMMRANPDGATPADFWRSCFEEHGLPYAAGLTDEQLSVLVHSPDFQPQDPQAALCLFDPEGTSGVTPEEAMEWLRDMHAGGLASIDASID